mmetsp:Transcript_122525/g.238333  ORF Transcript_122525/g.238333 Transcript_122525/m.238333 type:complete len:83 (+) Transcript_122525:248-496(+)
MKSCQALIQIVTGSRVHPSNYHLTKAIGQELMAPVRNISSELFGVKNPSGSINIHKIAARRILLSSKAFRQVLGPWLISWAM